MASRRRGPRDGRGYMLDRGVPPLAAALFAAALAMCAIAEARFGPRDRQDPVAVLTWFKGFDADGDHHLSLQEFALSSALQGPNRAEAHEEESDTEDMFIDAETRSFFDEGDLDGDGTLSMSELHALMFEERRPQGVQGSAQEEDEGLDDAAWNGDEHLQDEDTGRPPVSLYHLVQSRPVQELVEGLELAPIDAGKNTGECTPLHMALDLVGVRNANGHLEEIGEAEDLETKIDVLIGKGADLRHDCMGRSPLHMAIQSRSLRALNTILGNLTRDSGTAPSLPALNWAGCRHELQPGGGSPLHAAMYTNAFIAVVSKILVGHAEAGVSVQKMRRMGFFHESHIPKEELKGLHNSFKHWGLHIPKEVLTNDYSSYNRTLLNKHVFDFTSKFTRTLLDHGASPNEVDNDGDTPLHIAARAGDVQSCKMLLEKGADVAQQNNEGFTPIDAAVKGGHEKAVELLIAAADRGGLHALAQSVAGRRAQRGAVERGERSENPRRGVSGPLDGEGGGEGTCTGGRGGSGGWRGRCDSEVEISFCDIGEVDTRAGHVHQAIEEHFHLGRPLIVRGAVGERDWERVLANWTRAGLQRGFGGMSVAVLRQRGGAEQSSVLPMSEYLAWMSKYEGARDDPPPDWLSDMGLEQGHPLVDSHNEILRRYAGHLHTTYHLLVGPAHAGASPHFHGHHSARLMVYGRARWFLWPVARAFFSSRGIWEWYKRDYPRLTGADRPLECVQRAGDLMLVPAAWGHGVVYLEDAIGMASLFPS